MKRVLFILVYAAFIAQPTILLCQSANVLNVGVGLSAAANFHLSPRIYPAVISQLVPYSFLPTSKPSYSLIPEITLNVPIFRQFTFNVRTGYQQVAYSGVKPDFDNPIPILNPAGDVEQAIPEWQLDHLIRLLNIGVGIKWFAYEQFSISGGVTYGFVMSESRELSNQLLIRRGFPIDPPTRVQRHTLTDSFSNAPSTPRIAANIGVGYTFMFGESGGFLLSPELNYTYGLTSIKSGYGWKFNTLSCGITACIAL